MQVGIFNNERITNQKKKAMVSLYQNMKLHFTLVLKLLSSSCLTNFKKIFCIYEVELYTLVYDWLFSLGWEIGSKAGFLDHSRKYPHFPRRGNFCCLEAVCLRVTLCEKLYVVACTERFINKNVSTFKPRIN